MSHAVEPERIEMDDPEAGSTWFLSLVSIVLLAVTVLALVAIYFGFAEGEVEAKLARGPEQAVAELRLEQQTLLTETGSYEIENPDGDMERRIRIPVRDAMGLVIAEQKSRVADPGDAEEAIARR